MASCWEKPRTRFAKKKQLQNEHRRQFYVTVVNDCGVRCYCIFLAFAAMWININHSQVRTCICRAENIIGTQPARQSPPSSDILTECMMTQYDIDTERG